MTTEYSNSTIVGANQPQLRQLPATLANKKEEAALTKTDNILRLDFSQRQNIADSSQVKADKLADKLSDNDIDDSVSKLNSSSQLISRNLEFHIDKNSGRTVITVKDTNSNEVIRQIPSEQLLEISSRLKVLQESNNENSSATGILFTSQT
jgi:flagellar protein FlaG